MSICDFGMESKVNAQLLTIKVEKDHPLMLLAGFLPWAAMFQLILEDLKMTAKGQWFRGRKLKVRIHLGVYVLQQLYNLTDREVEYSVRDNAAFQLFCGKAFMDKWHAPDHTKIEKFRSRLTPDTQCQLANLIVQTAVQSGFAKADQLDIDSTIQEANLTYPTDSKMLKKLGLLTAKVANAIQRVVPQKLNGLVVDLKKIAKKAQACFFHKRYTSNEVKSKTLMSLLQSVQTPLKKVIASYESLASKERESLKWNEVRAAEQIFNHGKEYLKSVKHFIHSGESVPGKRLSFHLNEVECFSKGKPHKKYEFGRNVQLGRLAGNFVTVFKSTSVRMEDKKEFPSILNEHSEMFEGVQLESIATDKGYYSFSNVNEARNQKIAVIGIQEPCSVASKNKIKISKKDSQELYNRRSGIEPLIGQIKQGGQLGRSRMKSDKTTEASGYTAVMGFNMRQAIKVRQRECQEAA